jgi:hypothetical protein
MDIKKIGSICRDYRINVLNLSLTNFAKLNNENLQNIHAFENGRANNIKYIYMYLETGTDEQKEKLIKELFNIL